MDSQQGKESTMMSIKHTDAVAYSRKLCAEVTLSHTTPGGYWAVSWCDRYGKFHAGRRYSSEAAARADFEQLTQTA